MIYSLGLFLRLRSYGQVDFVFFLIIIIFCWWGADIDPTTAEAMLKFIYSGQIEDLDQENQQFYQILNVLYSEITFLLYYDLKSNYSVLSKEKENRLTYLSLI